MLNICVVFGGVSCEHDISIITAQQLMCNLDEYLYNIVPVYIDKNGCWLTGKALVGARSISEVISLCKECSILPNSRHLYIKKGKKYKKDCAIDCVVPCMHGVNGEDGALAGLLNLSNIPYTSSDILASALSMDKCLFKCICEGLKLPIVEGFDVNYREYVSNFDNVVSMIENMGFPIILKPSNLGSSIGIDVCRSMDEFLNSVKKSFRFSDKILIEKFVNIKKELNIALLYDNGKIVFSDIEEPITNNEILNFDDKYKRSGFSGISRIIPAEISEEIAEKLKSISREVYNKLGFFGVVRFDFILSDDDTLYINEVNSIPGSMANYLYVKSCFGYSKLISLLIRNAIVRNKQKGEVIQTIDTGVNLSSDMFLKK